MTRGIWITLLWLLGVTLVLPQIVPPANNAGHPPMHHY